jgi:REP-associated tyrosine transposase
MARIARVVVPGLPHHVTQRGVRSMPVFFSAGDRKEYLELMAASAERFGLEFWAWCLMKNHVHFLVVPKRADSLAKGIGDAHRRYTRMVNFRQGARGHLFQERFHSYLVQQDSHAVAVGRYIELNPVKARAAKTAEEYKWSSAAFNARKNRSDTLVSKRRLGEISGPWGKVLREAEDELERLRIELHMNTGRPLGSDKWVRSLERRLDRRLMAMPIGWPKGQPRKKGKKRD